MPPLRVVGNTKASPFNFNFNFGVLTKPYSTYNHGVSRGCSGGSSGVRPSHTLGRLWCGAKQRQWGGVRSLLERLTSPHWTQQPSLPKFRDGVGGMEEGKESGVITTVIPLTVTKPDTLSHNKV